ncbi:hypothetical protein BDR22DRAFT_895659 [Usnea florida]
MDLEAKAQLYWKLKILNRVDFINEVDLIGAIGTQIIVEDSGNQRLPRGLSVLVLHYNLSEKVYSRKKAKKTKGHPYIFEGAHNAGNAASRLGVRQANKEKKRWCKKC